MSKQIQTKLKDNIFNVLFHLNIARTKNEYVNILIDFYKIGDKLTYYCFEYEIQQMFTIIGQHLIFENDIVKTKYAIEIKNLFHIAINVMFTIGVTIFYEKVSPEQISILSSRLESLFNYIFTAKNWSSDTTPEYNRFYS